MQWRNFFWCTFLKIHPAIVQEEEDLDTAFALKIDDEPDLDVRNEMQAQYDVVRLLSLRTIVLIGQISSSRLAVMVTTCWCFCFCVFCKDKAAREAARAQEPEKTSKEVTMQF